MKERCSDHSNGKPPANRFFCPMCEGVGSEKPGACPKCGMALERNSAFQENGGRNFTCPMHPEVSQATPGSCPICGMALEPVTPQAAPEDDLELKDMTRRFRVGLILTIPVLVLSMGTMVPGLREVLAHLRPSENAWVQLCLSALVVFQSGWPFFERGARSLVSGHLNMFTLIAIGAGTSFGYSAVVTLMQVVAPATFTSDGGVPVYFESASIIIVLVLLGQILELKARAATGTAIKALINLAPKTAHLIDKGGEESEVDLESVIVGNRLRVRPGERVPVDGTVLEGSSWVDESMITGESKPVQKALKSPVTGGTINGAGSFVMQAEKVGSDTLLARIVQMVGAAQRSRAPIQRVADVVSGYFVPAVLVCAAATFLVWAIWGPEPRFSHALVNAVAVLIIACPCALGLATPMSIMVGVGRAAQLGILIRDAEALEQLEKVTVLALDKTGTLTEGKPTLCEVVAADMGNAASENFLLLAASVEAESEHPLAAAIVEGARARQMNLSRAEEFRSITGAGVQGKVQGRLVTVGKAELVSGPVPEALARRAMELRKQGQSVFFVGVNDAIVGLLSVADPVKETAPAAVRALHQLGIKLVILTGDHRETAVRIAEKLGIDQIEAEVTPDQKNEAIQRLQANGSRVAMAGDGVNDAPALARADVGIAMGTGTDVAIESAGITLVKGDLGTLVKAIHLSRATMANVRLNLLFAFLYNAIGIPIAAGALYPFTGLLLNPMLASAAMALSSVSVIANSLRLRNAVR